MKRRWTGFLAAVVMLVGSCLPVLSADAAGGAGTAALTIYYYAAGTVRKMVAAPYQAELARGSRYQVKSPSAEPFVLADPEQAVIEGTLDEDTEIRVYYSDGRKQADYTVIYIGRDGERETVLDKETFRAPAGETVNVEHKDFENFGKEAGQDISGEIEKIEEPVRQGYIFKGWDRALPDIMPEGEYVVNAVWEPGESRYTVLRWMENAEDDGLVP